MGSLLKDIYSPSFYDKFADILVQAVASVDKRQFIKQIFSEDFDNKELKDRMRHTARVLHAFFPDDYAKTVDLIKKIITLLRKNGVQGGLAFLFFPDYIASYGLDHFRISVKAIEYITQFISCEFAVRPFLLKYGEQMIRQMASWSLHENAQVRRLSTEGIRPRLPWAMSIPALKADPLPILPILENLKGDPSESVRRSVANNLNDIAKDHPGVVMGIAKRWKGLSKETDAVIRHGCRTLLKRGHAEVLQHYGLDGKKIKLTAFKIITPRVRIGESLQFGLSVVNTHRAKQMVRLEYAVYYKKANGQLSKKVFKISERIYQPGEKADILRKQRFTLITTRTFHPGRHELSIIINGLQKGIDRFELIG